MNSVHILSHSVNTAPGNGTWKSENNVIRVHREMSLLKAAAGEGHSIAFLPLFAPLFPAGKCIIMQPGTIHITRGLRERMQPAWPIYTSRSSESTEIEMHHKHHGESEY
jgi:hypothetical protein